MESKKLALLCRDLAENKKAENTVILDVRSLSSITDFFVITSGATEPHLRAIVNEITDRLREDHGVSPRAMDGDAGAAWQVMDYFDVIVHVMRTDVREKYDLEGLWGDAGKVAPRRAKEHRPKGKPRAGTAARRKAVGKRKARTARAHPGTAPNGQTNPSP
jgi:ribosome-associated protein